MDTLLESEPTVRFYGSEQWKISSYLSTIIPSFFMSIMTSLVDHAKGDVTYII
jgi:hypothetical protein